MESARLLLRGALVPVSTRPLHLRTPWVGGEGHVREGRRDPCVTPPGGSPSTPSRPSPLHLAGPGTGRPARRSYPTTAVDGIRRHAEDNPRLAPPPRPPTLDLPAPATRPITASARDRRAHRAPRPGEPPVGLYAHRGRATQARHHGFQDECRNRARSTRAAPSTTPRRAGLGTVPLRPGQGHLGERLLPLRLGDAAALLRLVC